METPETRSRILLATALAGALNVAFDVVAARTPLATPPYLLLDHAGDAFRDLLALDRTTILAVVAVVTAAVNGAIAGLIATAMAGVRRRAAAIGAVLSGIWLLSGGLMILVYLSPPAAVVLGSLAAGIPRAFAIALVLDRVVPRPTVAPETRGESASAPRT
jgi:hypothetical protein